MTKPRPIGSGETTISRAEPVDRRGAADDVDDRVDRADLVEVHVVEVRPVHLRLRLRQAEEGRVRQLLHPRREGRRVEDRADGRVGALGLRRVDVDVELRRDDAALHRRAEVEVEPGDRERRGGLGDDRRGDAEVDEGGDDHVAREAAGGVEEEHLARAGAAGEVFAGGGGGVGVVVVVRVVVVVVVGVVLRMVVVVVVRMLVGAVGVGVVVLHLPCACTRRMRAAANAAPNPLSMFTTVTPDAHDVSIPSSAASPSNAAP